MASSLGKRTRSAMREISPPPLRSKHLRRDLRVEPAKDQRHLHIFSWNVNGIGPLIQKPITSFFDPKAGPGSPLRKFLQRHEFPEILCLQEVKINPKDDTTKRTLERAANGNGASDGGPGYSAFLSLPCDKYNAKGSGGKVYGVATIIRDDISLKHVTREVSWDLEGRVLITNMNSKIAIINGYWVNGTDNAYKDSVTGEIAGTRHDRKRAFHQLMLNEALSLQDQGFHVVLAGDMNIARGPLDGHPHLRSGSSHVENRNDFNDKFFISETGMRGVDTFRHVHGERKKYTYHPPGKEWGSSCDRVDLIIVSRSVVESNGLLVEAEILDTPLDRGHSDHVPLYITLDIQKLSTS